MQISLKKWEHSRFECPPLSVDHRLLSAVFSRQIVLDQHRFVCGEDAIVHENFADLPVEISVADARTDGTLAGDSAQHGKLARAALHEHTVYEQAVGAVVMDRAGGGEVLPGATAGTRVEKSIPHLRSAEACIHVGLVGAHEGIAPGFIFCPGDRAVPCKGVAWSIGVCRLGDEKDGHRAPACYR